MSNKYKPKELEQKWQQRWEQDHLYEVHDNDRRPKWYALTMFPYTSGDLHIGHWYAMAPSDVQARFKRMRGFNVLHPMGFDAFGLPAENAAIRRNIHPQRWTMDNIANMRRQLKTMGSIYPWSHEVITCTPDYYKWNQWFFLKFYENNLAYRAKAAAVWCPTDQTVLANEQVKDGACERCGTLITRRDLEQWFFRITRYADELLDMGQIDWPEKIKIMQRNWIGRSEGVEIGFGIEHYGLPQQELRVFTTRPDTTYGVTFMVMAPEHELVPLLTTPECRREVESYIETARRQSEIERLSSETEKTGVFIGAYAINKLNGERVPIFIADYVLLTYGTGIVMGVPAHDARDFEFARRYRLPIRTVIAPPGWAGGELAEAYVEPSVMVNSGPFDGMPSDRGWQAISDHMEQRDIGRRTVSYRMRDWLISRQRYWGTPIPIIYCPSCGTVPVPYKDLPVLLPPDAQFKPTGESPLLYHEAFLKTHCPRCGAAARRETDTMDTFVDSSWYHLRYTSPHETNAPFDTARVKHWNPVDQYTGGAEHAVMHLLYARFFCKALRDLGLVDFSEPFTRLFNQGTIIYRGSKMSKSRGNVITPDPYVEELGADVVRCYLMFVGPWDHGGEWHDDGINGVVRWLDRVWELAHHDPAELRSAKLTPEALRDLARLRHQTIRKVTEDADRFRFNTMLSALMEYSNTLGHAWEQRSVTPEAWKESVKTLLLLLAPSCPHLAEELWEHLGQPYSIHSQPWPQWDEALAAEEQITLVVQVNGRVRDKLTVPASIDEAQAREQALASDKVRAHLDNKRVKTVVYVPGKLVNVVTE